MSECRTKDNGDFAFIITTTLHANADDIALARKFASELHASFVDRGNKSVQFLQEKNDVSHVLVVNRDKPTLLGPEGSYFFHPSMAKVRIKSLQMGKIDQMIAAMDLSEGDSLLDCTLGLAADAIVASYRVGSSGLVQGLEAVPVIVSLAGYGLAHYVDSNKKITEAMRRIKVKNAHHLEYLRCEADSAFDIVYIDPMFRKPQHKSDCMRPIRSLAEMGGVDRETLQEALRVARKRVVFKERRGSSEFARLGIEEVAGGKFSAVAYGILRK